MDMKRRKLLAGTALFAIAGTATADPQRKLVFGVISPRAAAQTRAGWQPFTDRLGASLGMPVEIKVFAETAQLVAAFLHGDVDLSWMGNSAALEVVEGDVGGVYAQMVTREGRTGYTSTLVVPKKLPITTLSELLQQAPHLRFSDGDPKSTSGFLVPLYYAFQKNGINDTRALFKSVTTGSHQQNMQRVARGEVDVATANNEEMAQFARDFPALAEQFRVVWTSPEIPQSPLVWKTALPLELRRRILRFTVDFGSKSEEERRILIQVNSLSGFRQATNRQLVNIADLEMFKARQAVNNNTSLSAAERARRIDEIILRASRLDLKLKLSAAER